MSLAGMYDMTPSQDTWSLTTPGIATINPHLSREFTPSPFSTCLTPDRIVFSGSWNGYLPVNCTIIPSGQQAYYPLGHNGGIGCTLLNASQTITPTVTWQTVTSLPN
jgi:hypothetical protein